MRTKSISPYEAIMTPITINETFPRVLRLGGARPSVHLVRRTATGVVACGAVRRWLFVFFGNLTCLEHLDEGHAEI